MLASFSSTISEIIARTAANLRARQMRQRGMQPQELVDLFQCASQRLAPLDEHDRLYI
jgi:hypothetical protein